MRTQEEISRRIRDSLRLQDPEISIEPGTPERRIIDAVAQNLAEINVDTFIQTYQYDVDTRFGQDLDDFLGLFGFARQAAKRAFGRVIFSRGTAAPAPILIPTGTQVMFPGNAVAAPILFQTVVDAIIPANGTNVEVPIEAVAAGTAGNVAANTITSIVSALGNVTSVNNVIATTGGTADESDEAFRTRFKSTVFRNIAGTADQFLALAIASALTERAIVIGPISRFSEYVQVPANGIITSGNPHAKYIYDYDYFLTSNGTESAEIYNPDIDYYFSITNNQPQLEIAPVIFEPPTDVPSAVIQGDLGNIVGAVRYSYTHVYDYETIDGVNVQGESKQSPDSNEIVFSTGGQATVTVPVGGVDVVARKVYRKIDDVYYLVGTIADNVTTTFNDNAAVLGHEPPKESLFEGNIVFFEHAYLSANSRNVIDEGNNITILNKVDVFISGEDIQPARDVVVAPTSTNTFVDDSSSRFHYQNYRRDFDGEYAGLANRLVPLIWTPVASLPSTITVGNSVYSLNQDYYLIKDITNLQQSFRCRDGIELSANMATALEGQQFIVDYSFNRLPVLTNQIINNHRQIGQDVLVHGATHRYFNINLVVMYTEGVAVSSVNTDIKNALSQFFLSQGFGAIIQLSDILQIVHGVNGVDNVRFALAGDDDNNPNNYGVQEVNSSGLILPQAPFTNDFYLSDIELAIFNNLGPTASGPLRRSQNTWTSGF